MRLRRSALVLAALVVLALLWSGCSRYQQASFAPGAASQADQAAERSEAAEEAGEVVVVAMSQAQTARKVVATADMSLVVADTAATVDQIQALIDELGGYISDTNLYKSSYGEAELLHGSLTLRIPAGRLEEAMQRLAAMAVDVRAQNLNREDVTDQYSDVEAQLRNLRATEEELRSLLAEVRQRPDATPEDILAVYESLSRIRGEIEQLQGRQNLLDDLVALSTLNVELTPDVVNRPLVDEGWRPAVVLREAVRALVNTLEFLGSALIWVGIYLLPLGLLALSILAVAVWLLRTLFRWYQRRRRRNSR